MARWSTRELTLPKGAWVVTGDTTCEASLRLGLPDHVQVSDLTGFLLSWLEPVL